MSNRRITTAPWVYGVLAFCVAACAFGVAVSSVQQGWLFWGLVVLLIVLLFALLDAATKRVESRCSTLHIVSRFRRTVIPKASVESLSAGGAAGFTLRLFDGRVVRLPWLGRDPQGVVERVRSWLMWT